jgi:thiol-disulfide isomerase/thioredoxin
MGLLARLGLVVASPRRAMAWYDRGHGAARPDSDLLWLMLLTVLLANARRVVAAGWLASIDPFAGLRAVASTLSQVLTVPLVFLLVAAPVIAAASRARRSLGRSFDLACVATMPLLVTEFIGPLALAVDVAAPRPLLALAFAWGGALAVLAVWQVRAGRSSDQDLAPGVLRRARWCGAGLVALGLSAATLQLVWIAEHRGLLRPMRLGDVAPEFALPRIGDGGALAEIHSLRELRGQVVVLDFWATWCGPCVRQLPQLARLSTELAGEGVKVVAVNLDDPRAAAELVSTMGGDLLLLFDHGDVSGSYGVVQLPHTVILDRGGTVRSVHRGGSSVLRGEIARLAREP